MTAGQLLEKTREVFVQRLQEKTSWGRNEIVQLFDQSVSKAVLTFHPMSEQKGPDTESVGYING